MPVIRTNEKSMAIDNRPSWSTVTSAGIFRVSILDGYFDNHFHDCHEYWLIYQGKAKVRSEGVDYYVKQGDIVCTKAGDEHDVIEVYEDLEAFWFEDATPEDGRIGHLHQDAEKAKGHVVAARPLPADFPI